MHHIRTKPVPSEACSPRRPARVRFALAKANIDAMLRDATARRAEGSWSSPWPASHKSSCASSGTPLLAANRTLFHITLQRRRPSGPVAYNPTGFHTTRPAVGLTVRILSTLINIVKYVCVILRHCLNNPTESHLFFYSMRLCFKGL